MHGISTITFVLHILIRRWYHYEFIIFNSLIKEILNIKMLTFNIKPIFYDLFFFMYQIIHFPEALLYEPVHEKTNNLSSDQV